MLYETWKWIMGRLLCKYSNRNKTNVVTIYLKSFSKRNLRKALCTVSEISSKPWTPQPHYQIRYENLNTNNFPHVDNIPSTRYELSSIALCYCDNSIYLLFSWKITPSPLPIWLLPLPNALEQSSMSDCQNYSNWVSGVRYCKKQ